MAGTRQRLPRLTPHTAMTVVRDKVALDRTARLLRPLVRPRPSSQPAARPNTTHGTRTLRAGCAYHTYNCKLHPFVTSQNSSLPLGHLGLPSSHALLKSNWRASQRLPCTPSHTVQPLGSLTTQPRSAGGGVASWPPVTGANAYQSNHLAYSVPQRLSVHTCSRWQAPQCRHPS